MAQLLFSHSCRENEILFWKMFLITASCCSKSGVTSLLFFKDRKTCVKWINRVFPNAVHEPTTNPNSRINGRWKTDIESVLSKFKIYPSNLGSGDMYLHIVEILAGESIEPIIEQVDRPEEC